MGCRWNKFHVSNRVKVVKLDDEAGESRYLGQCGMIRKIYYGTAGVGDTLSDPFADVLLDSGEKDGFFLSELDLDLTTTPIHRPRFKKAVVKVIGIRIEGEMVCG